MDILNRWPLMDDEPEATGGAAPDEAPEGQPNPDGRDEPEAPQPQEEKTLTQAEVNAIVAREKKKAEKAAREAFEAERKKADMSEIERAKAEAEEVRQQLEQERAARTAAERRAALTGKVADPQAALRLLDEDQHLDGDGNVNVKALLETYPFLAPQGGSVDLPGARTHKKAKLTMDDVKKMTPDEVNERWSEVQEVFRRG